MTAPTQATKAELVEQVALAFRANQNAANALDEAAARALGVNFTDMHCLDVVEQHGRITAGELARLSGLTSGAVTAVLDRLEQSGYARRVRDTADRRRVLVELTDRARTAAGRIYGPIGVEWRDVLGRRTAAELRTMLGVLEQGTGIAQRFARELGERVKEPVPWAR